MPGLKTSGNLYPFEVLVIRNSPNTPFRFEDLLSLQQKRFEERIPTLIFAELPPTLSLGYRQKQDDVVGGLNPSELEGVEVVQGDRGGLETWHGPGQWVVFTVTPIGFWTGKSLGAKQVVESLLRSVLGVVQKWIPEARIESGNKVGIWSSRGKLVSIGIRIRNAWVLSGFALNVVPGSQSFLGVNPCGLKGEKADFLVFGGFDSDRFEDLVSDLASALAQEVKKNDVSTKTLF